MLHCSFEPHFARLGAELGCHNKTILITLSHCHCHVKYRHDFTTLHSCLSSSHAGTFSLTLFKMIRFYRRATCFFLPRTRCFSTHSPLHGPLLLYHLYHHHLPSLSRSFIPSPLKPAPLSLSRVVPSRSFSSVEIDNISISDLRELVDQNETGENGEYMLLDVRESEELEELGDIPTSKHLARKYNL